MISALIILDVLVVGLRDHLPLIVHYTLHRPQAGPLFDLAVELVPTTYNPYALMLCFSGLFLHNVDAIDMLVMVSSVDVGMELLQSPCLRWLWGLGC